MAYDTVLERQLEYRLATVCFTLENCNDIMKTYKKVLCNANHIHRNIDKDLIFATRKYGGLEVSHLLYDVMGLSKTKLLMKHLRLNDKTEN